MVLFIWYAIYLHENWTYQTKSQLELIRIHQKLLAVDKLVKYHREVVQAQLDALFSGPVHSSTQQTFYRTIELVKGSFSE